VQMARHSGARGTARTTASYRQRLHAQ